MGANLIARLRAGEQEARATKDRLYDIAGNSDAAVSADAVGGVRARVAQSLENDGRVIDGVLTPASSRMMDELQRLSGLNIENRAVGAGFLSVLASNRRGQPSALKVLSRSVSVLMHFLGPPRTALTGPQPVRLFASSITGSPTPSTTLCFRGATRRWRHSDKPERRIRNGGRGSALMLGMMLMGSSTAS